MATYTPRKTMIPTGLDEVGLGFSMQRLPSETLSEFRQRLYLEARDPQGPTQSDYYRVAGRHLAILPTPIFRIDLILSGEVPLAADPFVEITSTRLRAYDDYENDSVDFELDLISRDGAYFLTDVETAFTGSSFFSIDVLSTGYEYLKSSLLRVGNTNGLVQGEPLRKSTVHKLARKYVKDLWGTQPDLFITEVAAYDDPAELGDYYIDRDNGVVWMRDPGVGSVSYTYRNFPYDLIYSPVRAVALNDPDMQYLMYDPLISDSTGVDEYVCLSPEGGRITNAVQLIHSLGWGE